MKMLQIEGNAINLLSFILCNQILLFSADTFEKKQDVGKEILPGPVFLTPNSESISCPRVVFEILKPEDLECSNDTMSVIVDGKIVLQKEMILWTNYSWTSDMSSGTHVAELMVGSEIGGQQSFFYGLWIVFHVSAGCLRFLSV